MGKMKAVSSLSLRQLLEKATLCKRAVFSVPLLPNLVHGVVPLYLLCIPRFRVMLLLQDMYSQGYTKPDNTSAKVVRVIHSCAQTRPDSIVSLLVHRNFSAGLAVSA